MHADNVATEEKISLETYRKCVKEKNIRFAILGQEECEECKNFFEHKKLHNSRDNLNDCERCKLNENHLKKRDEARIAYKQDAEMNVRGENTEKYWGSVDLQKIIMLPRMMGVKTCAFTRRLSHSMRHLQNWAKLIIMLWWCGMSPSLEGVLQISAVLSGTS